MKIFTWAQYKTHHTGISRKATIGINCILNISPENMFIGDYTYLNQAQLSSGENSSITIGSGCAIGYNVSIKAITHSKAKPTTNLNGNSQHIETSIKIGNHSWIGDNVFIREGVTLDNDVIVGANSVVTKSFDDNLIRAGIPAKIISK